MVFAFLEVNAAIIGSQLELAEEHFFRLQPGVEEPESVYEEQQHCWLQDMVLETLKTKVGSGMGDQAVYVPLSWSQIVAVLGPRYKDESRNYGTSYFMV